LKRSLESLLILVACLVSLLWLCPANAYGYGVKTPIPLPDGGTLSAYCFYPRCGIKGPLPGVVVGVGVGSQEIIQYQDHCQNLADRGFAVVLIDPSNYPLKLVPGPFSWYHGLGKAISDVNQVVVVGKLALTDKWYLQSIRAAVDYLCVSPLVDRSRIVLSGHSQPANAALTYACQDPRIKAIVWNYGGSPWVMPYNVFRLPPICIFHGTDDDVYDVKYAKNLAFDLHTNAKYYEFNLYPHQKHMFNVYYDLATETRFSRPVILESFERLISFLNRILCIPAPQMPARTSRR
jgi:dienelactone hydrolase